MRNFLQMRLEVAQLRLFFCLFWADAVRKPFAADSRTDSLPMRSGTVRVQSLTVSEAARDMKRLYAGQRRG